MTADPDRACQLPWTVETFRAFLAALPTRSDAPCPAVVAIDGRGGSGKSTLAARIRDVMPGSTVLHTDDIAWHLALFDWADELVEAVLAPLRQGRSVCHRPAVWQRHGRPGAIEVPAGCSLLILEGTGSGRRSLAPWVDAVIWVSCDHEQAQSRLAHRDGTGPAAALFRAQWTAAEREFLAHEPTWARADIVVAGDPVRTCGADRITVRRCSPGADADSASPGQTAHGAPSRPADGSPAALLPPRDPTTGSSP